MKMARLPLLKYASKQQLFLVLLLLSIFLASLFMFFKYREINSQTANTQTIEAINSNTTPNIPGWKIYTNSEFGYSLEIPNNWIVKDLGRANNASSIVGFMDKAPNSQKIQPVITVTIHDKENIEKLLEQIERYGHGTVISKEIIIINKVTGWKLEYDGQGYDEIQKKSIMVRGFLYYLPHKQGTIVLYAAVNSPGIDSSTFSTIINSLRLQEVDSNTEWRTYTNTIYNYSIQYPPDLFFNAERGQESRGVSITNYDETQFPSIEEIPNRLKVEVVALSILIYQNTPARNLREWVVKQPTYYRRDENTNDINIEDIDLETEKGIKLTRTEKTKTLSVIYLLRPDHLLIVSGVSTNESLQKSVEEILSSLSV